MSSASAVSLNGDHFNFLTKSFLTKSYGAEGHDAGIIVVPDAQLLFAGDYKRAGNDLVLSSQDQKYVVSDYFKGEKRPTLASTDGATLTGDVVSALTGHVQYAQAGAGASVEIIGHVMKMTGSASVVRNGVSVVLNVGDAVQKGDVIQTGSESSIGLTLIDGTAFAMASNARMVLNEMVYDPSGSSNSSLISLVQGTITFVAGATAKNGNMRVDTPVATMGIRGTAVLVEISADNGPTKFSVLLEPDGHTGSFNIYDKATGQLIGTVSQAGQVTFVSPSGVGLPAIATEQAKTAFDLQLEKSIIQDAFKLYFPNYNPDANPKSTDHPRTDIGVPQNTIVKNGFDVNGRPTITYTTTYLNPDTNTKTTVNVIHLNTPPTFIVANVVDNQDASGGIGFKLGDRVTILDPDINVAPFMDVSIPYKAGSGHLTSVTAPVGPGFLPLSYLSVSHTSSFDVAKFVSLNIATGQVTYNPTDFKFLSDNQTLVYTFTFIAASGVGSSGSDAATQTVTLSITGANDAARFDQADSQFGFSENAQTNSPSNADPHVLTVDLAFKDEDFTDTQFTYAKLGVVVTGDHAGNFTADALPYLTLNSANKSAIDPSTTFTGAHGTLNATFSASDSTFNYLAANEHLVFTYTVTISDSHNPNASTAPDATQTVTVTVTGANDDAIISGSGIGHDTGAVTEDAHATTETTSGTLSFTDVDLVDTHTVNVTPVGTTLGVLTTSATPAFDSTNGHTGSIVWNYSVDNSNPAIQALSEDETLTETFKISLFDGTSYIDQIVSVTITGTNDAPVVTASAAPLAYTENDTPSVIDAAITVSDIDSDMLVGAKISISANFVSSEDELGFVDADGITGSYNSATGVLTLSGLASVAAYEAALRSVTYFNSSDDPSGLSRTISYQVDDGAHFDHLSDVATATVSVTPVNDAPVNSVPAAQSVDEDTGLAISGLSVSDVDAGSSSITTTLSVLHGTLIVALVSGGAAVADSGTASVTLTGTQAEINATLSALANVIYQGDHDYNGPDTLTMLTSDGGSTGSGGTLTDSKSVEITINAVNDAPVNSVPAAQTVDEDNGLAISGLSVNDADAGSSSITTTLSVLHGTLIVASVSGGAAVADSGTASVTLTGTQAEINETLSALANVTYQGDHDYNGSDTLTVLTSDGGNSGSGGALTDSKSVEITVNAVNDAPVLDLNSADTPDIATGHSISLYNDNHTVAIAAAPTVTDVDNVTMAGATVVLTDGHAGDYLTIDGSNLLSGTFGTTGITWQITGTPGSSSDPLTVSFSGAASSGDYASAIEHVSFGTTGDAGSRDVAVSVNDGADNSNVAHVAIDVQAAPVYASPVISTDDVHLTMSGGPTGSYLFSNLSVSDGDAGDQFVVTAASSVSLPPGTITDSSNDPLPAAAGDVTNLLSTGIKYAPGGSPGTETVALTVTDTHGLSDTVNFVFNVTGVDPVSLTGNGQKDVIFSTVYSDFLTGGAGADQFVFTAGTGADTITDFESGSDQIVLNGFGAPPTDFANWLSAHTDSGSPGVLFLNTDQITLTGVVAANLIAHDFIFHA